MPGDEYRELEMLNIKDRENLPDERPPAELSQL